MTARDNEILFDLTTALSLFVEGIKLEQFLLFNRVLREVEDDLRKLFGRINHKTLDGLTKAELNRLLFTLRKSQSRIYSAYTAKLVEQLEAFMQLRIEIGAVLYASAYKTAKTGEPVQLSTPGAFDFIEDESKSLPFSPLFGLAVILPTGAPSLWSTIKNAPIAANGILPLSFIAAFGKSAQAAVENSIRKSYANRDTVAAALASLVDTSAKQGFSSALSRIALQARTVIDMTVGHVDQYASQAVASAIYNRYVWVSILDDGTTQICRSRNKRSFRYGDGPIPPAHYGCRSVTIPLASLFGDLDSPTLYTWLKRQSEEVQAEFIGAENAALLSADKINAKQFATLKVGKALPLNQFKSKLGLLINMVR
jgi:hypothetical protein